MDDIQEYEITITLCAEDFAECMGRAALSQDEFDSWARLVEKGLLSGQVEWDVMRECLRDELAAGEDGAV